MTTRELVEQKRAEKGAHSGRAHSKLGPSASSRWMVCAGSVGMSEDQPNKSTVFALEGTAAHEFNEFILSHGYDPRDWKGGVVDLEAASKEDMFLGTQASHLVDRMRYFEIDEEMVEGCELTIDVIEQYYSRVDGDELLLETRLDMSWVHPKLFGTGDILIYKRRTKQLIVLDYKYGSGHVVEVHDNPQVLTYAVGAAKMFEAEGVDEIVSVIIQPRAFHRDGPVRSTTIDSIDLTVFEGILTEAAKRTDDPDAELVAGEHCKFCPAAHGCDMLRGHVLHELIGLKPLKGKELTESMLPRIQNMTSERLGKLVREASVLEGFIRRVLQFAHAEALEGRIPEGTKLVDKRAYRKFTIPEDEIIMRLDLEGIPEEDMHKEPKLLTLAQLEKLLGKKKFAEVFGKSDDENKTWKKESTGYVLAPIEDDREAAKLSSGDAFGAVDDDDD